MEITSISDNATFVVFDLQYVGDATNPQACFTWNLSAARFLPPPFAGAAPTTTPPTVLDSYIQLPLVDIPAVVHERLFQVSHAFLAEAGAEPAPTALTYFAKWLSTFHDPEQPLYLISHGCFRSDKAVLETELYRARVHLPPKTYFMDSLWLFRLRFPDLQSYSLKSLYMLATKKAISKPHLSLFNVYALSDILTYFFTNDNSFEFAGIVYSPYHSPLTRIPSVGLFTERVLIEKELCSVEALVHLFHSRFGGNQALFELFLANEIMVTASASKGITQYCNCFYAS